MITKTPKPKLNISTRQMRKSVREWLAAERATIAQALMLQSAIEAGNIAGSDYSGHRYGATDEVGDVARYQRRTETGPSNARALDDGSGCGCLLETFEKLKGYRPRGAFKAEPAKETFALAMMLGMGDTPARSPWAAAAKRGIEDYVIAQEAKAYA